MSKEIKSVIINGESYNVPTAVAECIDDLEHEIQDLREDMYDMQLEINFLN